MTERRSERWYAGNDRDAYIHRAWMRRGLPDDAFDGRPHIAIANTASDLVPCNRAPRRHLPKRRERASGRPAACRSTLPVMSLGETQVRPTAMLWRNLAAMIAEETVPGQPDRRTRPAGRLRQDHPGAAHGRGLGGPAGDRRPGRPDADGHVPGCAARLRDRRLAAQRGGPVGHAGSRDVHRHRVVDDPQRRPLQHDGDGLDDGGHGRGARDDHPGHGRHAGAG